MNNKPVKLGITGSIGMGKTTIAREIGKFDFPIWDADLAVHSLYRKGKKGYDIIKNLVPEAAYEQNVNRDILAKAILKKPVLLKQINTLIYPFINSDRKQFINKFKKKKLLVFDIPMLFENSHELWLDKVIVATAPFIIQKKRVLARDKMTEEKFNHMLSKQIKNDEKIKKADYVVDTNIRIEDLSKTIANILNEILT